MRYYYKSQTGYLNLKTPSDNPDYIPMTKEEFEKATKPKEPTAEQLALQAKRKLIAEKKALLVKYREDVEQVDLFGMTRTDYEEKKALCRQLVLELRELEKINRR